MENFNRPENNDNVPELDNVGNVSFDEVAEIYDYEKMGDTIEEELEEFRGKSSIEQREVNEEVSNGFSLDALDDVGEGVNVGIREEEGEIEEEEPLEEYFSSAEFMIWLLELALVWSTNFYLKNQELDKISISEFEKTKTEQRFLVKSLAKVLRKHNTKVSPEMELLFAIGSAYGMKIKGIIKKQRERKEEDLIKHKKNSAKIIKISPKVAVKEKLKTNIEEYNKKEIFIFDPNGIEKEEEEEEVKSNGINIIG